MTQTITGRVCGALIEQFWQLQDHATCTAPAPPEPAPWYHTDGRPGHAVVHVTREQAAATLNRRLRRALANLKDKGVGYAPGSHRHC